MTIDFVELFKWATPWLQAGAWAGFLILVVVCWWLDRQYRATRDKYDSLQEVRAKELVEVTRTVIEMTQSFRENANAVTAQGELIRQLMHTRRE